MTTPTRRYLVPVPRLEQEVDAIKTAIAESYQLASEAPVKVILLLTPTDDQLRRSTLVEAIGTSAAAALLAGRQVAVADDVYLLHDSERTFRDRWTHGVILAMYAGKSMLDKVDDCPNAYAVVVLPGRKDQTSEWARAWNPEIVGEKLKGPSKPLIDNPVVEKALELLTDHVNLNNDLLTDHDRGPVVELLRRLRDLGELYDPSALRAWAVGHGWSPRGADELQRVAKAVLERRRIRVGRQQWWNDSIVEQLRAEARGKA